MPTIDARNFSKFDVQNIVFAKPVDYQVPGADITFFRVQMSVRCEKTQQSLPFTVGLPGPLYSTGIDKKTPPGDMSDPPKYSKAVINLCMHNRPEATEEQIEWIKKHREVMDHIRDHMVSIARSVRRRGLVKEQMGKSFDPLNIPMLLDPRDKTEIEDENGNPIVDTSKRPFFNPELVIKKGNSPTGVPEMTILTNFYEMDDVDEFGKRIKIDPTELINTATEKKRFDFYGAVDYNHIFVNQATISCKIRVPDGYIRRHGDRAMASDLPPGLAEKMGAGELSASKKRSLANSEGDIEKKSQSNVDNGGQGGGGDGSEHKKKRSDTEWSADKHIPEKGTETSPASANMSNSHISATETETGTGTGTGTGAEEAGDAGSIVDEAEMHSSVESPQEKQPSAVVPNSKPKKVMTKPRPASSSGSAASGKK